MNSNACSQPQVERPSPVILRLQHLGPVPALKNSKRAILDSQTGQLRTLTEKSVKAWMASATGLFVSQLGSTIRTREGATLTGPSLRSWIASSLPLDDCWTVLPDVRIISLLCQPGEEGAEITIEPM